MKEHTDIDILRGSWLENLSYAKMLNELYGANYEKAKRQWKLCNDIVSKMNELKQQDEIQDKDSTG